MNWANKLNSQILNSDELIKPNIEIVILNSFGVLQNYFKYAKSVFIGKSTVKSLEEVGDAIVAFYGAPIDVKDHELWACRTAIKMQENLGILRKGWQAEGDRWSKRKFATLIKFNN